MPNFFAFQQGTESRAARLGEADSPVQQGRFRILPSSAHTLGHRTSLTNLFSSWGRNSAAVRPEPHRRPNEAADDDLDDFDDDRGILEQWISPNAKVVERIVDYWWNRLLVLVLLPAVIVIGWCAVPFPMRRLPTSDPSAPTEGPHGQPTRAISFPFFLLVYYGFYNLVALLYITKLFNMYSVNWWPARLGGLTTYLMFLAGSMSIGIPIYFFLPPAWSQMNLIWIGLTTLTMVSPLLIAFALMHVHSSHMSVPARPNEGTPFLFSAGTFRWGSYDAVGPPSGARRRRNSWSLPASYKRFLWFVVALLLSILGFVLGEAYAEIYLRTSPHASIDAVIYVYSWVATIYMLDGVTGWILAAKVGSYPLGWVFKLYFSLTYQTYVRALYARLRSPGQFALLQLISSSFVVVLQPLILLRPTHKLQVLLGFNGQAYDEYSKYIARAFYLRGIAENVSMLSFLGWVAVLHFTPNGKVYPYLQLPTKRGEGPGNEYTFSLTFWAAWITWGCEITAGWIVRRIMQWGFKINVTKEAKEDMARYPEMLPCAIVLIIHVLQNMLFSIIRLRFYGM